MKVYYADKELNEKYGEMFSHRALPNHCYDNVFDHFNEMRRNEKDFKIFYGWVQIFKGESMYARHACYMIGDSIVDTTLMRKGFSKIEGCEYIPIKVMTQKEYFDMIVLESEKHTGKVDLIGALREVEVPLMREMMKQGKAVLS